MTLLPADMFRYARGEVVTIDSGLKVRLDRPLDWFAVTDHAEYLGLADQLRRGDPALLADPTGKKWYDMYKQGPQMALKAAWEAIDFIFLNKPEINNPQLAAGAWAEATEAVEKFNDPGVFTTLHGFEWTSAPEGNNLHRTVIFRDGVDRVKQIIPFSSFDGQDPEALWKYMDRYEKLTGGQVLAIPHNGNLSNGLMFTAETSDGRPMDAAYAEARISHEPVMEVTQVKGDGETHPFLSPNDEFANFERWFDVGNIAATPTPKQNSMLQYEYARSALKLGLKLESELGVNPYAFGMVGAATSTPASFPLRRQLSRSVSHFRAVADALAGDVAKVRGRQGCDLGLDGAGRGPWRRMGAGEHPRGDLDALKRKEVYATSGDRITVRVFAGWDFVPEDLVRSDFAKHGYDGGVPMGGDLSKAPAWKSPAFMVRALRDPDGPNLDRVQMVKGWLGADGHTNERIYIIWPSPTGARSARTAAARPRWAARSTSRRRATPTPSARHF